MQLQQVMTRVGPSLQKAYGTEENWCSKGQVLLAGAMLAC